MTCCSYPIRFTKLSEPILRALEMISAHRTSNRHVSNDIDKIINELAKKKTENKF